MNRLKTFEIYKSGSIKIGEIKASCITNACKELESTLKKPIEYKLHGKEYATIKYTNSRTIYNDFVIMLK